MPPATIEMPGVTLIEDAPLAARNTLRVQARCAWLAELGDAATLPRVLALPALRKLPQLVLGSGSNVLFTADWPGLIVQLRNGGIEHMGETGEHVLLRVGAGKPWDELVRWSLAQGLVGLENLILIPGTVGAAPIQNIGAYGVEVARSIECVEAWDRELERHVELPAADCAFGYRDSCFKRAPERWIITAVRFSLARHGALHMDYAGIRGELASLRIDQPRAVHVAEAVQRLRTRKLPDPALIGNAGSFFKNPQVDAVCATALRTQEPDLPQWPQADGGSKLSAAWMIEAVGCKGLRAGDAGISEHHALVLVNHGTASGAQLWALAERVREAVHMRFAVLLEAEPRVLPQPTPIPAQHWTRHE